MRAVKGNRAYSITDADKAFYKKQGFDIIGDNGEILEHGEGKVVPYEKYAEVVAENESLKARLAELVQNEGGIPDKDQEPIPLTKLKKEELKSLANELGIDVPIKATIEELVTLIEAKQAEDKGE